MTMIPASISINQLHGYKDLVIPFDDPYLVLIAENGQGKTSILNLIYGALCGDVTRLASINFRDLHISFSDGTEFSIFSSDLEEIPVGTKGPGLSYLKNKLSGRDFDMAVTQMKSGVDHIKVHKMLRHDRTLSIAAFRDAAAELLGLHETNSSELRETLEKIRSKFSCTPLYLPTYRRIEEDFARFGLEETPTSTKGMNFGVHDVENKLEEMRTAILTSSNESFSKVNGEILAKLINGFELNREDIEQVRSLDRLDLVLERIGGHMRSDEKEEIERLFVTGRLFYENKYEPLVYFLSNMVKVYGQQKKYDVALREFTEKCNGYLVDQKLIYDESAVSVQAFNKFTEERVDLRDMSSGEKQIISLFSKLYLDSITGDTKENLAIFFDEPELSLSVEWQESLLPDVISSAKCKFLFAVTHSPFILKGMKPYARDMDAFIQRKIRNV